MQQKGSHTQGSNLRLLRFFGKIFTMIEQSVQSPFHLTHCKLIESEDPLTEAQKNIFSSSRSSSQNFRLLLVESSVNVRRVYH